MLVHMRRSDGCLKKTIIPVVLETTTEPGRAGFMWLALLFVCIDTFVEEICYEYGEEEGSCSSSC